MRVTIPIYLSSIFWLAQMSRSRVGTYKITNYALQIPTNIGCEHEEYAAYCTLHRMWTREYDTSYTMYHRMWTKDATPCTIGCEQKIRTRECAAYCTLKSELTCSSRTLRGSLCGSLPVFADSNDTKLNDYIFPKQSLPSQGYKQENPTYTIPCTIGWEQKNTLHVTTCTFITHYTMKRDYMRRPENTGGTGGVPGILLVVKGHKFEQLLFHTGWNVRPRSTYKKFSGSGTKL
jgi:hypothetical protein